MRSRVSRILPATARLRRGVLLTATGGMLLLAAGCSLAPKYERPAPPVAESWSATQAVATPSRLASAATPADPAELGWRDMFGDPRLQALVALALENNRDLRVAALNVELTQAQYRIRRADQLPSVGVSGSFVRQHTPADLSVTGQQATTSAFTVGGVASWELDLFGRIRSLSEAALEQYLASEEARRSTHLSLVAAVATQYLTLRAAEDQVALARGTLETVEASLRLTRRSHEVGRVSELDLRSAESQVQTARFNLSVAEQQRFRAENALVLLVGRALPSDLPPAVPLDAQAIVAELPAGVPSEVLQRRPDILAAEHALRSANASVGAARAAFFPSISLTAFGGVASSSLDGLFSGSPPMWSFAPRIDVPIFRGGALRASLDASELRTSIEVARYERAIQVGFREVADALASRAALDEQLDAERARVDAEQRRYQLSELRYRTGIDSYLTVLTAQRDLFAAQQQLIQSRFARLANLIDLYRALGGGWLERTASR